MVAAQSLKSKNLGPIVNSRPFLVSTLDLIAKFFSLHRWALVIVAVGFVSRFFVSGSESYWNDEILSVYVYGSRHDSLYQALVALSNASVHPPLYQTLLWFWMQVFGTSEVATRTLSNIFVAFATFFLYLLVRRAFPGPAAPIAALGFTLSFSAMSYGLETRSYALTMFLATFSSYLAFHSLFRRTKKFDFFDFFLGFALLSANLGLLLTHYYNVFFVLGQGMLVLIFVWLRKLGSARFLNIFSFGTLGPALIFAVVWLPILLRQYASKSSKFSTDGLPSRNPFEVLRRSLVEVNFQSTVSLVLLGFALLVALVIASSPLVLRGASVGAIMRSSLEVTFFFLWFLLPIVIAWAVFAALGVERYSSRYFLYSLPPLFALLSIGLLGGFALIFRKREILNPVRALVGGLLVLTLVLPGGYQGATKAKQDWRGNVGDVIAVVESNPNNRYLVVEMSFSSFPRSTY